MELENSDTKQVKDENDSKDFKFLIDPNYFVKGDESNEPLYITTNDKNVKNLINIQTVFNYISQGGENGLNNLKYFLDRVTIDLNEDSEYWTTPLSYSIFLREEEIALFLIDKGADVNKIDNSECYPIHYACSKFSYKELIGHERNNKEMKKLVIKMILKKVNVGSRNPINGYFPPEDALLNKYNFIYEHLMKYVKNICSKKDTYYKNEFKLLSEWIEYEKKNFGIDYKDIYKSSYWKYTKYLLEGKEKEALKMVDDDPNIIHNIDNLGQSSLHYAVFKNLRKLATRLIELGIDHTRKNVNGETAIDICKYHENHGPKMKNLLDYEINLRKKKFERAWNNLNNEFNINLKEEDNNESPKSHNEFIINENIQKLIKDEEDEKEKKRLSEEKKADKIRKKADENKKIKELKKKKQLEEEAHKAMLLEKEREEKRKVLDEERKRKKLEEENLRQLAYDEFLRERELEKIEFERMEFEKSELDRKKNEKKLREQEYVINSKDELKSIHLDNCIENEMKNRLLSLYDSYLNNDGMDTLPSGKKVPITFITCN